MSSKRLFVIVIVLLNLAGLTAVGLSMLNQLACEGQPINNNVAPTPAQQIFGDRIIAQSFTAPRDGLNRLDIFFQTYGRRNTHDVILRLYEVPASDAFSLDGPVIFETTFNAATVWDQSWRTFSLSPVTDSAGKHYLIILTSPESTDGNAITVGGIERNSYLPGTAFLGATPVQADITFRSCYQMSVSEKFQVLAHQLTHDRPGPWGEPDFYALLVVLYGLLAAGFFWQLAKLS